MFVIVHVLPTTIDENNLLDTPDIKAEPSYYYSLTDVRNVIQTHWHHYKSLIDECFVLDTKTFRTWELNEDRELVPVAHAYQRIPHAY